MFCRNIELGLLHMLRNGLASMRLWINTCRSLASCLAAWLPGCVAGAV